MKFEKLLRGDDYVGRDYTEQSDDDVVKVTVKSLERGEASVYLPQGIEVEVANDEPSAVLVETL